MRCWIFFLLPFFIAILSAASSVTDEDLEKIATEVSIELHRRYSSSQLFSDAEFLASLVAIGRVMGSAMEPAVYLGTVNYLENGAEGLSTSIKAKLSNFYSKADVQTKSKFRKCLHIALGNMKFPLFWDIVLRAEKLKYYSFLANYQATLDKLMDNILAFERILPINKPMAVDAARKELAMKRRWDLNENEVLALIALSKKVSSIFIDSRLLGSRSSIMPGYFDGCQIGTLLVKVFPQKIRAEVNSTWLSSSPSEPAEKPGKLTILLESVAQIDLVEVQLVGNWNGAAKKNLELVLKDLFWNSNEIWAKRVKRFELSWIANREMTAEKVQKAVADAIGIEVSMLNKT